MAKVTYLFGAGASCNSLPLVTEIPDRLQSFLEYIEGRTYETPDMFEKKIGYDNKNVYDIYVIFIQDCKAIIEQVKNHQSIDTYAKKLRITAGRDRDKSKLYGRLKAILSCFFIYEQLKNPIDSRYDAFFASILEDTDTSFAKNLRILSWNYDFQFEKAYSTYSGLPSIANNQVRLNIFPSTLDAEDYKDGFSIFKLNGTTGFFKANERNNFHIHDELDSILSHKLVFAFMQLYGGVLANDPNIKLLLSFAWERSWREETKKLIDAAIRAVENTEVLVIVGYSIPFFNRNVDRDIMRNMGETVKSIYIQDKFPDKVLESLASVWAGELPSKIHLKDNTDQYFLPPEL